VLKPGGKLISISGPPDPAFAREIGANWVVRLLLRLLSSNVRTGSLMQRLNNKAETPVIVVAQRLHEEAGAEVRIPAISGLREKAP